MATLALFDFDGTLFRSPEPPAWAGKGWYVSALSLSPPCVPLEPGPEWWVGPTVQAAREAIADPDTYTILATGRIDRVFRWIIPALLKSNALGFDEVHLNPGGGPDSTEIFKRNLLWNTLHKFPFIDHVRMWDDRRDLLFGYARMLEQAGYTVEPTPVRVAPMEVSCTLRDFQERMASRVARRYLVGRL